MAYADVRQPPDARAIAGAAGLQLAVGVLIVTGLSNVDLPFVPPPEAEQTPIDYRIPPPPPPPEPSATAEPRQTPPQPDEVYRPDPIRDYFEQTPTIPTTPTLPDLDEVLDIPGPATTGTPDTGTRPAPQPSFRPVAAAPRSPPASWFSTADYPSTAVRRELEGTVGYRLQIAASGKVEGCTVTRSSGHASLDQATCRLLTRRGEFTPARDSRGESVRGRFDAEIVWRLP